MTLKVKVLKHLNQSYVLKLKPEVKSVIESGNSQVQNLRFSASRNRSPIAYASFVNPGLAVVHRRRLGNW